MKNRILSAIVLLAIALPCILLSEGSRILLIAAAGLLCVREYCHCIRDKCAVHCAVLLLYLYVTAEACLCLMHAELSAHLISLVACIYLTMLSGVVDKNISGYGAAYTLAGLAYPFLLFSTVMLIASCDIWLETFMLACLSTWMCDSFALFGGMLFGRHKIAPLASPNKTVEGCICGALFAVITGFILHFHPVFTGISLSICVLTAFLASTAGQIGDLTESLVKRMFGIKDFSNMIPGHGGMLDRADSLLFSIPVTWLCLHIAGM